MAEAKHAKMSVSTVLLHIYYKMCTIYTFWYEVC